jgi:hypothetical protein
VSTRRPLCAISGRSQQQQLFVGFMSRAEFPDGNPFLVLRLSRGLQNGEVSYNGVAPLIPSRNRARHRIAARIVAAS